MAGDCIFIHELTVHGIVGVYAWEQNAPRPLVLDVELSVDCRDAAASDALRDTVDYGKVCAELEALAGERRFQLLETFAETAARRLFERFPIDGLQISVGKPGAVPAARTVGVRISRRREDYAACGV